MKKKKLKNFSEKAYEILNALKANLEVLKGKGQDTVFIKTLETSVKKMDRLEKELVTLKEKLGNKKVVFEQERELTFELVKDAHKVLKKELGIKVKPEKKQKPEKKDKKQKSELVDKTEIAEGPK